MIQSVEQYIPQLQSDPFVANPKEQARLAYAARRHDIQDRHSKDMSVGHLGKRNLKAYDHVMEDRARPSEEEVIAESFNGHFDPSEELSTHDYLYDIPVYESDPSPFDYDGPWSPQKDLEREMASRAQTETMAKGLLSLVESGEIKPWDAYLRFMGSLSVAEHDRIDKLSRPYIYPTNRR